MPRLHGYRERLHQPLYDTLIRTTGVPTTAVVNGAALFGAASVGQIAQTNLTTSGQLSSDQTYIILALRCFMFFDGTNRRANYLNTTSQLIWTLTLGTKPMFQAYSWYFPAGGGTWGYDSTTSVFSNGEPSSNAIMKLARPIVVPVRQNFSASANWFPIGTTDGLALINAGASDDIKFIQFLLDGQLTRDVQ